MSTGRIVAAGVVGGIVMFIWGAIAHMALPLGEMGVKNLPQETMVLSALKFSIEERGLYRFPGMVIADKSEAAQKAWEEKYKKGPRGMLAFDPEGGAMAPGMLGAEFGSNLFAALLLAVVLARVPGGIGTKAFLGLVLGVFAWASIDLSYWNWFRFPSKFTLAEGIDQGVSGLLTGLAIGVVLGRKPATAPPLF